MCATSILSFFISNTATTALMVPIVVAVIKELENCRAGYVQRRILVLLYRFIKNILVKNSKVGILKSLKNLTMKVSISPEFQKIV